MGVRRQIYLDESDNRLLEEKSRSTGLSVSELIRQAVERCYGSRRKLGWDEVFTVPLQVGAAPDAWVHDPLFDEALFDDIEADLSRPGSRGSTRESA